MARAVQLSELRERVRDMADVQNAVRAFPNARVDEYINSAIAAWYDTVVETQGQDFWVRTADITLTGAEPPRYALPTDFAYMRRVEFLLDGRRFELRPVSMHELREWDDTAFAGVFWGRREASCYGGYRLGGETTDATGVYAPHIWFPKGWTGTVTIYYIPQYPVLVDDTDSFDAINGWEEWVVLKAAIRILRKMRRDASDLKEDLAEQDKRLRSMANARDLSHPETIAEVEFY